MNTFSLPFELRRKIYADAWAPRLELRLFLWDGRLEESPCLGANLGEELVESWFPPGDHGKGYLRRLQSLWGPYYRCEELQKGLVWHPDHPGITREHNSISMLFVCKQILQEHSSGDPDQSFKGGSEVLPAEAAPKLRMWRQVWLSLAALPHLERLSIWLDHDGMTWSDMDERSLLRPLALASWRDRVRVAVHMPRLPRDKVRPGLHYHADNAEGGLPFRIVRRVRRHDLTPLGERWMGVFPDVERRSSRTMSGVSLRSWSAGTKHPNTPP